MTLSDWCWTGCVRIIRWTVRNWLSRCVNGELQIDKDMHRSDKKKTSSRSCALKGKEGVQGVRGERRKRESTRDEAKSQEGRDKPLLKSKRTKRTSRTEGDVPRLCRAFPLWIGQNRKCRIPKYK